MGMMPAFFFLTIPSCHHLSKVLESNLNMTLASSLICILLGPMDLFLLSLPSCNVDDVSLSGPANRPRKLKGQRADLTSGKKSSQGPSTICHYVPGPLSSKLTLSFSLSFGAEVLENFLSPFTILPCFISSESYSIRVCWVFFLF